MGDIHRISKHKHSNGSTEYRYYSRRGQIIAIEDDSRIYNFQETAEFVRKYQIHSRAETKNI